LDTTNVITINVAITIIITIFEIVRMIMKLDCFVMAHKANIRIIITVTVVIVTAAIAVIHSSFMAIIAMTMMCYSEVN